MGARDVFQRLGFGNIALRLAVSVLLVCFSSLARTAHAVEISQTGESGGLVDFAIAIAFLAVALIAVSVIAIRWSDLTTGAALKRQVRRTEAELAEIMERDRVAINEIPEIFRKISVGISNMMSEIEELNNKNIELREAIKGASSISGDMESLIGVIAVLKEAQREVARRDFGEQANRLGVVNGIQATIQACQDIISGKSDFDRVLQSGGWDHVLNYGALLDVFFGNVDGSFGLRCAYRVARAVIEVSLHRKGIRLYVPVPLSTLSQHARSEIGDMHSTDLLGLAQNPEIRERVARAAGDLPNGATLVAYGYKTGWSGPAGGRRMAVVVFDPSIWWL